MLLLDTKRVRAQRSPRVRCRRWGKKYGCGSCKRPCICACLVLFDLKRSALAWHPCRPAPLGGGRPLCVAGRRVSAQCGQHQPVPPTASTAAAAAAAARAVAGVPPVEAGGEGARQSRGRSVLGQAVAGPLPGARLFPGQGVVKAQVGQPLPRAHMRGCVRCGENGARCRSWGCFGWCCELDTRVLRSVPKERSTAARTTYCLPCCSTTCRTVTPHVPYDLAARAICLCVHTGMCHVSCAL